MFCQRDNSPRREREWLEELVQEAHEVVEPVVVDPMAGSFHERDLGGFEMARAAVRRWVGGPALLAVDPQGGAADGAPQRVDLAFPPNQRPGGAPPACAT